MFCYFRPTLLSVVTAPPPREPPPRAPATGTCSGLCSCDPDRDQREASWSQPVSPSARALAVRGVHLWTQQRALGPCAPLAPSVPRALGPREPGGQTVLRPSVQPPLLPPVGGNSHPRSGSSEAGASSPVPRVPQPGPRAPGVWVCHRVSLGPTPPHAPPRGLPARGQGTACRADLRARQPRGPRAGPCVCPGPAAPSSLSCFPRGPAALGLLRLAASSMSVRKALARVRVPCVGLKALDCGALPLGPVPVPPPPAPPPAQVSEIY